MPTADITRDLFFTTVRIAQGPKTVATAFIYQLYGTDSTELYLVTNRHVAELATREDVTLHMLAAHGDEPLYGEDVSYDLPKSSRWFYPHNTLVDVALVRFEPILSELAGAGKSSHLVSIEDWGPDQSDDEMDNYDWIEDVCFIGYPEGLYDELSLTPIARRGTAASPFQRDWNGMPAFLVDASVLQGSSGSPVFAISRGTFRNGNAYSAGSRATFLGVISKGFRLPRIGGIDVQEYRNLGIVYNWRTVRELASMARAEQG